MYRKYGKRALDFTIALIGLIILAIPMIIIAVCIVIDSGWPIIFRQERVGKKQKVFTIYKFRTMINHAYEIGGIVNSANDSRITRIGGVLRRTSLDELPQLFNILKGDMAIIGPRPILPVEFEEFKDEEKYKARHDVLPGLFCTVDIDYRASASRKMQMDMDIEYINEMSFANDLRVFLGVIKTVVSGKNVYREE
nr:sugar transferase [uncultured Agathobacter sp.]